MIDGSAYTGGWETGHQRLKQYQVDIDDNWRLRDWDNHPSDPGWEVGRYTECHDDLRKKIQANEIVFDTVLPGRVGSSRPIIRSAFLIEQVADNELEFSQFVFLNGDANQGVEADIIRGYKSLSREEIAGYLQQMKDSEAYSVYDCGERPDSIRPELWEKMLSEAGRGDGSRGCSSSSSACSSSNCSPDTDKYDDNSIC
jgi:hypothetical protein